MKEGGQVVLMDEDQIKDFESFILQIPGIYCNPILAKFNTYKRVIKADPVTDEAPEKIRHFEEGNPVPIKETEHKAVGKIYGPKGQSEIITAE